MRRVQIGPVKNSWTTRKTWGPDSSLNISEKPNSSPASALGSVGGLGPKRRVASRGLTKEELSNFQEPSSQAQSLHLPLCRGFQENVNALSEQNRSQRSANPRLTVSRPYPAERHARNDGPGLRRLAPREDQ